MSSRKQCRQFNRSTSTGTTTRIGIPFVLAVCLQFASFGASAQKYTAFYYDSHGVLLQVEDVSDADLAARNLVSLDSTLQPIPMVTGNSKPLRAGTNIPMSQLAVVAVYYTHDETARQDNDSDTSDVQSKPEKVEDLRFVPDRTL